MYHFIQKKKQTHSASNAQFSEETWRLLPPTAELIDKKPASDWGAPEVFQERGPISEMFWKLLWRRCCCCCCSTASCICGWEAVLVDLWRDSQDFPRGCTLWVLCNCIPLKKKNKKRWGTLAIFNVSFRIKGTCKEVYVWPVSLKDLFFFVCVHSTAREVFYCLPGDILFLVTNVRLRSNGVLLEAASAIIMLQRCGQDERLHCRYRPDS